MEMTQTGRYYIGDPAYILPEAIYHQVWGDKYGFQDGEVKVPGEMVGIEGQTFTFVVYGTCHGDGEYFPSQIRTERGNERDLAKTIDVDSGTIACIPEALWDAGVNAEREGIVVQVNNWIDFDGDPDGIFNIYWDGPRNRLFIDTCLSEDDEEERFDAMDYDDDTMPW